MKKKSSLTLDDEFLEYCRLNNIDDVEKLAKDTFNRGFTILKYGETPFGLKPTEKIVEKEVVKEVIVEVEKIVNVEVIKEVPINKLNDALNKFNKATFMKNSNLNTLYDE